MKQIINFALLFIFAIVLFSCEQEVVGRWKDNIKLSTKTVEFSALSDSVTVTTGGSEWWLSGISVDNVHFYGFEGVDIHADSYIIKEDDFVFERLNKNTFSIKATENPLNAKRVITVVLQNGDYFDRVTITQKPRQ